MKKVPFDYEYFKANPETQLVCRDESIEPPVFLIEKKVKNNYPLVFENKDGSIELYTYGGVYRTFSVDKKKIYSC